MQTPIDRLAPDDGPEQESDGSSVVMRIGHIVGAGVVAALASSFPASLRMGEEGSAGRALVQWVVVSALATPLAVGLVAVLRRARVGLRLLMGERVQLLAIGVLWWSVIELGILSLFGALLRKTTHHHALAGVTFAVFAIVTGLVVGIFARKATLVLARGGSSLQRSGLIIASSAAFLVVMLVGVRTSKAEGLHTASALIDGLALAITSTIASSKMLSRHRALAIVGVPIAVLVVMVGLTMLRFDPKLHASLGEVAPLHTLVLSLFGT